MVIGLQGVGVYVGTSNRGSIARIHTDGFGVPRFPVPVSSTGSKPTEPRDN